MPSLYDILGPIKSFGGEANYGTTLDDSVEREQNSAPWSHFVDAVSIKRQGRDALSLTHP